MGGRFLPNVASVSVSTRGLRSTSLGRWGTMFSPSKTGESAHEIQKDINRCNAFPPAVSRSRLFYRVQSAETSAPSQRWFSSTSSPGQEPTTPSEVKRWHASLHNGKSKACRAEYRNVIMPSRAKVNSCEAHPQSRVQLGFSGFVSFSPYSCLMVSSFCMKQEHMTVFGESHERCVYASAVAQWDDPDDIPRLAKVTSVLERRHLHSFRTTQCYCQAYYSVLNARRIPV